MSAVMGGGGGGGSGEYSQLLQRRISELEGSRAREVAGSRAMRRLEECELLTADESELCQVFDNVVIDERVPVGDRIQTVRQYFVDEVTTTLELDRVLSFEMAEFNQANAKHSTVVEAIAAKRKEHNAVTQLRDKLQDLCRMIQQQTKDIVANSNEFESEEKRKSSSLDVQFTTSIEHISSQLVTQEESLTAQDAENKELRDKLNQFEEHMLLRSQHYAAQLKAKELELQLEDAKCAQQNHLYQQTANKLESKSAKLTAVQSSNEEMMTQLTMYAEKFEMFEEALTRSTSMFEQFEHKIKDLDEKLEKINEEKRLRNDICRKLDLTLFGIIDSKSKPDKEVEEALSVKESLQNECRRLQQARTEMLQRQKNAKSESP